MNSAYSVSVVALRNSTAYIGFSDQQVSGLAGLKVESQVGGAAGFLGWWSSSQK